MRLYNALTQEVEEFVPEKEPVTVYVCGITPYDTTHLGHAFTYTSFDILIRYLESQGHRVLYTENVTDIDDDILRKAEQVRDNWRTLGDRWTAHFIRDMITLNVRPPDYYPRATDVISDIIGAVESLLAAGVAYEAKGSVYFDVEQWPSYGELCCMPPSEMLPLANERGNNPNDPNKRHPLDFVLWQAQAPGEPAWPSPWGPGRPGWHIECSTMAHRYLGPTVDIHGGGADLLFPHHESEIAQAEAATGHTPFVRFWMHTAMVRYEGEKMSKSLGNLVMVRDLLKEYSPDAVRLYLGGHHYRDAWSYHTKEMQQAQVWAGELRQAMTIDGGDQTVGVEAVEAEAAMRRFYEALGNDLDTPAALRILLELGQRIRQAAELGRPVARAREALRQMGETFGLRLAADAAEARVVAGGEKHLQRFTGAEQGTASKAA